MEHEWIHEGLPYCNEDAQVWLDDGSVRLVTRPIGWGGIYFTDCTYPEQNVICDPDRIKAWRPDGSQRPGSLLNRLTAPNWDAQVQANPWDFLIGNALRL